MTRIEKLIDVALQLYIEMERRRDRRDQPTTVYEAAGLANVLVQECEKGHALTVREAFAAHDAKGPTTDADLAWPSDRRDAVTS